MSKWFSKAANRAWVYRVTMAAVPLLVAYGVISSDKAPLVLAALAAVFTPAVALRNLTPDSAPVAELADAPDSNSGS